MVDLCLLGCGGGMPMPFRNLSSTLLNFKGRKILIDCGEGTQVSMRIVGWGFKSIDVICITHCHGDHIVGLPGLLSTIGNSGRIDGEIRLNFIKLDHSSPCLGYSFYFKRDREFLLKKAEENNVPKILWSKLQKGNEDIIIYEGKEYIKEMVLGEERKGIKLSLITDSRPQDKMIEFIKESDLFICEGTYGNNEDIEKAVKNKHMTFAEAAKLARNGNCKELLLTHFSPAMINPKLYEDNAKDIFANTIIGEDRFIKSLSFT